MNTIDKYGDDLTAAKFIDGSLDEYIDDKITKIPYAAFKNCTELSVVSLPAVLSCGMSAFEGCTNLLSVEMPLLSHLRQRTFCSCEKLVSVYFPSVGSMEHRVFHDCKKLKKAVFPICSTIVNAGFEQCYELESLYLLSSSVVKLNDTNVFNSTPMVDSSYLNRYGSIFVRASLLSAFQSATNWASLSERLVGLTDEQIAALDNE